MSMELRFESNGAPPAVPRDSATVILARDSSEGIEVFMLERNLKSDFVGGAFVFPGGVLDPDDCDPLLYELTDGPDPESAAKLMDAPPEKALGFYLCAIRETFEECGALLARNANGDLVPNEHQDQRERIHSHELSLKSFATENNLRFAADLLKPWSRWITPVITPKRYDTRFFVAEFPDEANALLHDEVESASSRWITPKEALKGYKAGSFTIIFPTRVTLTQLARFNKVSELLTEERDLAPTAPEIRQLDEGTIKIFIAGDPEPYDP
ncbi:MAG: NUDIX hydrolase [Actinomycetota bacterium]